MRTALLCLVLGLSTHFAFAARPQLGGTYQIPVNDPTLLPYSFYELTSAETNHIISVNHIVFWLPVELTGVQLPYFYLIRQRNGEWTNMNLSGKCNFEDPYMACDVQFKNIEIDLQKVRAVLQAKQLEPEIVSRREAVSSFFGGELHGIVKVRVPDEMLENFRKDFGH